MVLVLFLVPPACKDRGAAVAPDRAVQTTRPIRPVSRRPDARAASTPDARTATRGEKKDARVLPPEARVDPEAYANLIDGSRKIRGVVKDLSPCGAPGWKGANRDQRRTLDRGARHLKDAAARLAKRARPPRYLVRHIKEAASDAERLKTAVDGPACKTMLAIKIRLDKAFHNWTVWASSGGT